MRLCFVCQYIMVGVPLARLFPVQLDVTPRRYLLVSVVMPTTLLSTSFIFLYIKLFLSSFLFQCRADLIILSSTFLVHLPASIPYRYFNSLLPLHSQFTVTLNNNALRWLSTLFPITTLQFPAFLTSHFLPKKII